jgi:hypothetical protein
MDITSRIIRNFPKRRRESKAPDVDEVLNQVLY